jgi:Eco57I restriction-modification methylase
MLLYEMSLEQIKKLMLDELPVKTYEKNIFGEVFTHPDLIEAMLDTLPKKVWSNPDLKWLEPCAGIGHFGVFIYLRLMDGLASVVPNPGQRHKHILNKMLYMNELNPTNVKRMKQIFGSNANIYKGDILTKSFSNMKFDIIIGNPPFQDSQTDIQNRTLGGKNKLYERITTYCLDTLLNKDGYLLFLVPDNMFSGNSNSYKKLLDYQVLYLNLDPLINSYFPKIQQFICFFLLQKKTNHTHSSTNIQNSTSNFSVKLLDRVVNPVRNWTPKTEMLTKKYISDIRNNIVYNRGKPLSNYFINGHAKYKLIYTPSTKLSTNKLELAPGFGIKKIVIFAISPDLKFEADIAGKYGVGPNTFYIPISTTHEAKKIQSFLKSQDYKELALATKTTRQFLKISFIEHLNLDKNINSTKTKTHKHNKTFIKKKTLKKKNS